jgi:hypothetical protein
MGEKMTDNLKTEYDIPAGQEWEVRRFQPEDAEGVVRLFQSVYGSGYPVRTYMEQQLLIAENAANRTISSVAKTPRGDVIGHTALFNSAPHPGTYESGAGVVHAAYRGGKGIFTGLVAHGLELAATIPGVDAIFGEPVCNHIFSQKMSVRLKFVPRALEVDLMPAAAYEKEASAAGRVAAFLDFHTCTKKPHRVYLPRIYAEELRYFYDGLNDERDMVFAEDGIFAENATDIRSQVFDFAGVARVAVHTAGTDFATRLEALEKDLRNKGVLVIQIWLNLAGPWIGGAVQILRRNGYFLGGVLPRWFDTDGLLMQKIFKHPDWEGICTYTDRYKKIHELVRSDWERLNKEKHDGN